MTWEPLLTTAAHWWPDTYISLIHSVQDYRGLQGWGGSEGRKRDKSKTKQQKHKQGNVVINYMPFWKKTRMKIILLLKVNVLICLKIVISSCNKIKLGPDATILRVISRSLRIDIKEWKHVEQGERSKSEALFHLFCSLFVKYSLPHWITVRIHKMGL